MCRIASMCHSTLILSAKQTHLIDWIFFHQMDDKTSTSSEVEKLREDARKRQLGEGLIDALIDYGVTDIQHLENFCDEDFEELRSKYKLKP